MDNLTHVIPQRWMELTWEEGWTIVLGMNLVFMLSYWPIGLAFLHVDIYGEPRWMLKYKTQAGINQPPKKEEVIRLMKQNTTNYFLVGLPYSVLHYVLHKLRGSDVSFRFPSFGEFAVHIAVCIVMEEITFYYSHRLLHSPYLYKAVHKRHHEWTAPIGLGAVYAHPIEFAFGNLWTIASGPLIMGSCHVTTMSWIAMATVVTVIHHSGYHLPFLPSPEFHDYHHLKFVGNYGVLGILDRLHSTYSPAGILDRLHSTYSPAGILDRLHSTYSPAFLKSKQYSRHKIIFSPSGMK